jgi:hypothetical protein
VKFCELPQQEKLLEQGPSSSMTTMDNRVGGTRRGGCNVLY